MNYLIAAQTDIGPVKKTNQDSYCIQTARSKRYGNLLFAVVCDGMGGLKKGEVASATVVARFTDLFAQSLPILLSQRTMDFALLRKEWTHLLNRLNADIGNYGLDHNISLGTTVVAALCIGNKLYVVNIGDSRLYKIQNNVSRLTQDQSLVAREISAGKLAPDQEEKDTRRNVLLQCVGASHVLQPEFLEYTLESNTVYLLCTDGFRHEIQEEELLGLLSPRVVRSERGMQDVLVEIIGLLQQRNEQDNMTGVAFKTVH